MYTNINIDNAKSFIHLDDLNNMEQTNKFLDL